MLPAEIHQPLPGVWIWHAYDPSVKADLFSSRILARSGLYMIDPIPLRRLLAAGPVIGIIVTNANHHRAAVDFSERFAAPIFASGAAFPGLRPTRFWEVTKDAEFCGALEAIEIEGAVPGEIALYNPTDGGTLIVGDALINFEPYGFTFLPRKYCENEKQMRQSLRQLLAKLAERMLFAHGTPILSAATSRLRQLLDAK